MYKVDLALNNLQWSLLYKTKPKHIKLEVMTYLTCNACFRNVNKNDDWLICCYINLCRFFNVKSIFYINNQFYF